MTTGTAATRRARRRSPDVRPCRRAAEPRAVIIALHGGASTAAYSTVPVIRTCPFLRSGAEHGYTMVALDRPGYAARHRIRTRWSDPNNVSRWRMGQWKRRSGRTLAGRGYYFSATPPARAGGADGRRRARRTRHRSRIGRHRRGIPPATAEILKTTTLPSDQGLRDILWHPADLYPDDVLSGMTNSTSGALYELGMTKSWPQQDFPALAARIGVPVQFTVAEHERVWKSDPRRSRRSARCSPRSAFVINDQQPPGITCHFHSGPPTITRSAVVR